jgi:hypothetical protein
MSEDVVDLALLGDDLDVGSQQYTCANPRCDEQFQRRPGPGRPKDFHDDECRRSAEKDLRRTLARLEHLERQVEQLRARAAAYVRTSVDDAAAAGGTITEAQKRAAQRAVDEVRGMSRFLERNDQDEYASELLKLYRAVEPLVEVIR